VRKIKILLVDDDKSIQDLYDQGLGNDIFAKRFAGNGKEALEIYDEWNPDVIVLDIMMPVMAGYLVLREIRGKRDDKSTTIIMATASTDSQDIRECITLGIQGYIIKPFKLKEIGDTLLRYIQQDQGKPGVKHPVLEYRSE
jgi:CheY-like chemotaxis protein